MSNDKPHLKGQRQFRKNRTSDQGQDSTRRLLFPNVVQTKTEKEDKKPSTPKLCRRKSKSRLPKRWIKSHESGAKETKKARHQKSPVSRRCVDCSSEGTSEEESEEDIPQNTDKTTPTHDKITFLTRLKRLRQCSFDRSLTIVRGTLRRTFTSALLPSERLLQVAEERSKSNSSYENLRDFSTDTLLCSLASEQNYRETLTPWHTCCPSVAHRAFCVHSETTSTASNKSSSTSTQLRRKRSDTSHRDRHIVVSKKWSQTPFFCEKKPLLPSPGRNVLTDEGTAWSGDDCAYPHRTMAPLTEAGQHVRGSFPNTLLRQHPLVSPWRCPPKVFQMKSTMPPSPLYCRLTRMLTSSSSPHDAESPGTSHETECLPHCEDLKSALCSNINSHRDSEFPIEMPVCGSEHAEGLEQSRRPHGCGVQQKQCITSCAGGIRERGEFKFPVMRQFPVLVTSNVENDSASDKKDQHVGRTEDKSGFTSNRYFLDDRHEQKSVCYGIAGKGKALVQIHKIDTNRETSHSLVNDKGETVLGTNMTSCCRQDRLQRSQKISSSVSEPSENSQVRIKSATSEKPSASMKLKKEASDTNVDANATPKRRKCKNRRRSETERKKANGNKPKKSLSEIFRALREKGCLVSNCPRCCQGITSTAKAQTSKERPSKSRRPQNAWKQLHKEQTPGWNCDKIKDDAVLPQTTTALKGKTVGVRKADSVTKQASQEVKDSASKRKSSHRESSFETDLRKIKRDISLYLKIRKAIDAECQVSKASSGALKDKPEEHLSEDRRHDNRDLKRYIPDPKVKQSPRSKAAMMFAGSSQSEGLVCVTKDKSPTGKNRKKQIQSDSIDIRDLVRTSGGKEQAESEELYQRDRNTNEHFDTTVGNSPAYQKLPAVPPNSPVLHRSLNAARNASRKHGSHHVKHRPSRPEEPLQVAKVVLNETATCGGTAYQHGRPLAVSSNSGAQSGSSVLSQWTTELGDVLQKRQTFVKVRSVLIKRDSAAGNKQKCNDAGMSRLHSTRQAAGPKGLASKRLFMIQSARNSISKSVNVRGGAVDPLQFVSVVGQPPSLISSFTPVRAKGKKSTSVTGTKLAPRNAGFRTVTSVTKSHSLSTPRHDSELSVVGAMPFVLKEGRQLDYSPARENKTVFPGQNRARGRQTLRPNDGGVGRKDKDYSTNCSSKCGHTLHVHGRSDHKICRPSHRQYLDFLHLISVTTKS